ncbi:MAG TPA: hypothetical protein VF661_16175 [Actinomycetales bacterium]|jgi:hypothetical protein
MTPPDRDALLTTYRRLVMHELPALARAQRWVVTADHCFGRIVLDHAVGGRWYDHLERGRTPAFTRLSDDQLRTAVAAAEQMRDGGDPVVRALDAQSLRWRGKRAKGRDDGEALRTRGTRAAPG